MLKTLLPSGKDYVEGRIESSTQVAVAKFRGGPEIKVQEPTKNFAMVFGCGLGEGLLSNTSFVDDVISLYLSQKHIDANFIEIPKSY
jgi:hypothetical protein